MQGLAQIMAGRGQELGLGDIGLLGRFLLGRQAGNGFEVVEAQHRRFQKYLVDGPPEIDEHQIVEHQHAGHDQMHQPADHGDAHEQRQHQQGEEAVIGGQMHGQKGHGARADAHQHDDQKGLVDAAIRDVEQRPRRSPQDARKQARDREPALPDIDALLRLGILPVTAADDHAHRQQRVHRRPPGQQGGMRDAALPHHQDDQRRIDVADQVDGQGILVEGAQLDRADTIIRIGPEQEIEEFHAPAPNRSCMVRAPHRRPAGDTARIRLMSFPCAVNATGVG